MRADTTTTILDQKNDNLCALINKVVDHALAGEVVNYNDILNIFEQLKADISECKKTNVNLYTLKIEIKIKELN